MPKPITYRTDIPGYLIETPLGLINTQPTQIPFEPIREKLREAIEKYKENHPEKRHEYQEFNKLFDAFASEKTFDTKNIDETFNKQYEYDGVKLRLITGWYFGYYTWLKLAVLLESKELVQDMLKYGAQVDVKNLDVYRTGCTALHFAAETGNVAIFQLLIDAGANINATTSYHETPLHRAVQNGNTEAVKILLEFKAKVDLGDGTNSTPLHYAALFDNTEAAKILLESGANPNAQTNYQTTPLHLAARKGNIEVAEMLVKYGADPNLKDKWGHTAIDKARISHPEIAEYLSSIKDGLPQDHSLIEEKSATNSALVQEKNESSETAKVEDESPQDQAEVEEESATSSSVPGATPPESQESKSNDDGFIGPIFKWLRLPPISGEKEAEIIPFDPPLNKGKVVEVHYVAMPGQEECPEGGDHY